MLCAIGCSASTLQSQLKAKKSRPPPRPSLIHHEYSLAYPGSTNSERRGPWWLALDGTHLKGTVNFAERCGPGDDDGPPLGRLSSEKTPAPFASSPSPSPFTRRNFRVNEQ